MTTPCWTKAVRRDSLRCQLGSVWSLGLTRGQSGGCTAPGRDRGPAGTQCRPDQQKPSNRDGHYTLANRQWVQQLGGSHGVPRWDTAMAGLPPRPPFQPANQGRKVFYWGIKMAKKNASVGGLRQADNCSKRWGGGIKGTYFSDLGPPCVQ